MGQSQGFPRGGPHSCPNVSDINIRGLDHLEDASYYVISVHFVMYVSVNFSDPSHRHIIVMYGSDRFLSIRFLNASPSLKTPHMHCSPYLVVMGHLEWGCLIRA